MTGMKLTNNQLKTSLNRTVTFIDDLGDVIIGNNVNSASQTMHNKLIYNSQIGNTSIGFDCLTATQSPGDASNKLASTNFVQEAVNNLTNKNFTDCTATTVTTSDVSNKIATTQFIDNKLATPNTYVGTSLATFSTLNLTSSYQDILTITIPVAGTYEIIMNVMGSADQQQTVTNILFNSTTSTEIPNSLFAIVTPNLGLRTLTNISKSMILQNVAANTVLKVRSKQSGGICFIENNATNGSTFISYRMLGLTNNVVTPNIFSAFKVTSINFDDYSLICTDAANLYIKCNTTNSLKLTIYSGNLCNGVANNDSLTLVNNVQNAESLTSAVGNINGVGRIIIGTLGNLNNEIYKYTVQTIQVTPGYLFNWVVEKLV
jgi:hypothetical protein